MNVISVRRRTGLIVMHNTQTILPFCVKHNMIIMILKKKRKSLQGSKCLPCSHAYGACEHSPKITTYLFKCRYSLVHVCFKYIYNYPSIGMPCMLTFIDDDEKCMKCRRKYLPWDPCVRLIQVVSRNLFLATDSYE